MKTILIAAAIALAVATPASAQQSRCSSWQNGTAFCYGADASHDTYTYRNGNLSQQSQGFPVYTPPPLPSQWCNGDESQGFC